MADPRRASEHDPVLVATLALQRLSPIAALVAITHRASTVVVGGIALVGALLGFLQASRAGRLSRRVLAADLDRTMIAIGERSPARIRGGSHDELLGAIWRALHARQLLARQTEPSMWASAVALPIACVLVAMNGLELAAVVLAAFVVGLLVRVPLARRHRVLLHAMYELYGAVVSDVGHAVRGLDDLQAHGLTDVVRDRLRVHASTLAEADARVTRAGAWASWLPLGAGVAVLAPYVVWRGGADWMHVALQAAWLAVLGPIAVTLARALVDRARQRSEGAILDTLCAFPPDLPVQKPFGAPKDFAPIEWDSITFRYPPPIDAERLAASDTTKSTSTTAGRAVLEDVSITWSGARPLAIVGANGSGKSTVLALMLRLVDPSEGTVRIGGVDLRHVEAREFRDAIAYVPQRPLVLEGMTVREAVKLVAPDAVDARILEALDVVGLRARLEARG